ncbi:cell division protein FtsX [Parafrankia colletiae]|uniref:Cell division protein FtsX n=1 Tax=Parafrankia colletiae TaxID=573497 RepID=A0A1S1QGI9_9ACTN|nr:permease-like cell division protein FtsX [Parafrankia colletiae]MCK9902603.1 permease-like cell division protein FtsX [Frankia sp. Cpl3]OHV31394.1 cell division protein FtsX [Parafrankia colletiae]
MRPGPLLAALVTTLRRNVAMTCAVVVTVTICLAMLGAGLLLRAQAHTVDDFLLDQIEIVVDLQDGLDDADRQALRDELAADPLVVGVTYESKQDVYERFRRDFRTSPDVVAGVGPDDLPASFRLALTDPRDAAVIVETYTGRDGVEAVRDQRALLGPLYRFLDAFTLGAFVLAAVQAVASFVLIYTMIRISAHARRRETAIMRLVGATNAAIRAPFMLESALAGLLGGLLAVGALVLAKIYLVDGRFARQTMFPLFGWDAVWVAAATVLAVGVTAAAGMASVALRRHLRA